MAQKSIVPDWIAHRPAHPASPEEVLGRKLIGDHSIGGAAAPSNLAGEGIWYGFVSVDEKDPLTDEVGFGQGPVTLICEPEQSILLVFKDASAGSHGEFHRAIGTTRVDDDDFVCPRQRM
jgi:hypothetical protein